MTLTIERLGHRGDGIAAGPVFVPLTLPGEVVEGDIENGKMLSAKIVTPSADRVKPPCSHFKSCGGCSLQHASDEFVEGWKANVVRTALAAQNIDATIVGVTTSPPMSRRRATLSARRTKKGALVGFHGRASDVIVEIPNCQLLHPDLILAVPVLQNLTVIGGSRKGEISFTITRSDKGLDIAAVGGKPLDGQLRITLASAVARHNVARLTWDEEPVAEAFQPEQTFGAAQVIPPPGAFLQATEDSEAALLSSIKRAIGPAKRVVDLFSGCGTFTLPLAIDSEVHAVESEADMLAALDQGWRNAEGLKKVTTETRDLFRRPLMPDELSKFDAVVIDPPRAGGEAQIGELSRSPITKIAAVSCNPVTFARDMKLLIEAGYQIDWIEVIDQFRWSPHVEIVAAITRKDAYVASKLSKL